MNPSLEQDEIRLTVPADPSSSRVARQAAGGVASRLDFSHDQLDEVRLAIAEAWSVLLGPTARPGTVTVRLAVRGPGELEATLALEADRAATWDLDAAEEGVASEPVDPRTLADPAGDPHDHAETVLTQVADEVSIEPGRVTLVLRAR